MNFDDVMEAKLTEEIGLKQPVVYTEDDREAVATHEAGHATVAYFLGKNRRLEVLSIIKRRGSLGMLAHGDTEERFTQDAEPRSSPGSRSPWAAWSPRSCASAMPARDPRATSRTPPAWRRAWSGRSAWRGR